MSANYAGGHTYPTRIIRIGPEIGQVVTVTADTHVASLIEFESGQVVTMVASLDVAANRFYIEVYGTEGSLRLPDPRYFGPR